MISKVWVTPESTLRLGIIDTYEVLDEFGNVLVDSLDPWQVAMVTKLLTALGVQYVED